MKYRTGGVMVAVFLSWLVLALADGKPVDVIETTFTQVYPPADNALFARSQGQKRAVILIHGIHARAITAADVRRPHFHSWQKSGSPLIATLSKHADVFAYAYGQNATIDEVVSFGELASNVRLLRQLGYGEIVLIGHSAGGLIARLFVEDHPEAGVTKVIQVCAPNGGSPWGKAAFALQEEHEAFGASLSEEACQRRQESRKHKKIPAQVQFVCIVATGTPGSAVGDGVILCSCQWSHDLQAQGVPAFALPTPHFYAIRGKEGAAMIADLVRSNTPRWTAEQVAEGRSRVLRVK